MSNDERAVTIACQIAQSEGREISDSTARTIASWYAEGMGVGQAFASTGSIEDPTLLWRELGAGYEHESAPFRLALDMLGTYLVNAGKRGPVAGWSDLWVR